MTTVTVRVDEITKKKPPKSLLTLGLTFQL